MWPASGEQMQNTTWRDIGPYYIGMWGVLAKTEYISRHNKAAAFLHWSICKDHDIKIRDKCYNRAQAKLKTVMHNKDNNYVTIMWDMPVNTDRTITPNRLDIGVKNLSEFNLKNDWYDYSIR